MWQHGTRDVNYTKKVGIELLHVALIAGSVSEVSSVRYANVRECIYLISSTIPASIYPALFTKTSIVP
jgi:hypothetical protein